MNKLHRRVEITKKLRESILNESAGCCVYCGHLAECVDHIVPYSFSYDNSRDNLVASCHICNLIATDLVFESFDEKYEYINKQPRQPKYRNRNQLSICIDCKIPFRMNWEGSTRFVCKNCMR